MKIKMVKSTSFQIFLFLALGTQEHTFIYLIGKKRERIIKATEKSLPGKQVILRSALEEE